MKQDLLDEIIHIVVCDSVRAVANRINALGFSIQYVKGTRATYVILDKVRRKVGHANFTHLPSVQAAAVYCALLHYEGEYDADSKPE